MARRGWRWAVGEWKADGEGQRPATAGSGLAFLGALTVRSGALYAGMPVIDSPMIRPWMSWVPS